MKLKTLLTRIATDKKDEIPDDLEAYFEEFISEKLLNSGTLQIAFGISAYEMEEIYNEAYQFYQDDIYLESSTAFRWLVLLNPFVYKYWNGLAASLQLLKKYEKALHAYALAGLLESENPYPHFHAFECYKALNNSEDAEKALDLAYQRTVGQKAYQPLQEEIILLKKELHDVFLNPKFDISRTKSPPI